MPRWRHTARQRYRRRPAPPRPCCLTRNETTAGDAEPVKQPYVPGMMDPADSHNLEVMSDEEYHKMSQGLFSSQDDDPASPESADSECSGCGSNGSSMLSSLDGRELTAVLPRTGPCMPRHSTLVSGQRRRRRRPVPAEATGMLVERAEVEVEQQGVRTSVRAAVRDKSSQG